jgi:hypothetical protein
MQALFDGVALGAGAWVFMRGVSAIFTLVRDVLG